jgi:stearoyl-CoA desaturase (delta-9 desaturase)
MNIDIDRLFFSGLLDLPWWGYVIAALGLTHLTIVAVTVFLHRHQAHHALDLHPAVSHLFRLWLWLTTGMVTKEWVAIHRKHHAKVESPEDPHSPQVLGINRVLWGGVLLYVRESRKRETVERYGHGTPDDWLERTIYSRYVKLGLSLMGLVDLVLFGIVPGVLIFLTQIVWIPFWAAGVINGIGHYCGYRNWHTEDSSANIVPWGILIGGEELHNNHHAFRTSAKLSNRWYEFDIGWMYIRMLELCGLAKVNRVAPVPRVVSPRPTPDLDMLRAVIANRYDVMARYAKSLKRTLAAERDVLRCTAPRDARALRDVERLLEGGGVTDRADQRKLAAVLERSCALQTVYSMRRELMALWERSTAPKEQLVHRLQDWCRRAESSGIPPLVAFSQRLRSYA